MEDILKLFKNEDLKFFLVAVIVSLAVFFNSYLYKFYGVENVYAVQATGSAQTLTVSVQSTLTFSVSSDNFGNLTPGTPRFATSTLNVSTNNSTGWFTILYGDDRSTTNTVCDLDSDADTTVVDQTEWGPPAATTTAGNAVQIGSFINSGDVLAFRVMTASGTAAFRAPTWWGSADDYSNNASTLWAGVASSTIYRQIGNSSVTGNNALNTVLYYLDFNAASTTGAYSCPLTFSATSN